MEKKKRMTSMPVSGETFVLFGLLDYEKNPQRPQHMASRIARANNVLYIEAPFSWTGFLRNGLREFRKISRYLQGVKLITPSLALWTPPPSFYPFDKLISVSKLYAQLVSRGVENALATVSWKRTPILCVTRPWGAWLSAMMRHRLLVVDWYTPWVEHWAHIILKNRFWKPLVQFNYWLKERLAHRALAQADLIVCGARIYQEQAKEWGFNSIFLPNGSEMSLWSLSASDKEVVPEELSDIPHPRIGVIAARIHKDIVDLELIAEVARKRPNWEWVLVGTPLGNLCTLYSLPNVHVLGHKPYRQLWKYVAGFNLCAIPYRLNSTTQSGIPVKLVEYLPSGKAVISYPSPEIQSDPDLSSVIYFASTAKEFILAAEHILSGEASDLTEKRKLLAHRFDWDTLTRFLLRAIAKQLETKITRDSILIEQQCNDRGEKA